MLSNATCKIIIYLSKDLVLLYRSISKKIWINWFDINSQVSVDVYLDIIIMRGNRGRGVGCWELDVNNSKSEYFLYLYISEILMILWIPTDMIHQIKFRSWLIHTVYLYKNWCSDRYFYNLCMKRKRMRGNTKHSNIRISAWKREFIFAFTMLRKGLQLL